jgi:hypothetical protein
MFGLPGLPSQRREAIPRQTLVRAGCVRGLLGMPDLVLIQDPLLDRVPELAAPMAQAISTVRGRGGAVLWITAATVSQAARFVEPDKLFHLRDAGLVRMRGRR